jgi:hypothetical protein
MRTLCWLLWVLSAGLCVQSSAQNFNVRHDMFNEGGFEFGWGVEVVPAGDAMIFFGGTYIEDGLQYGSALSTVSISSQGEFGEGFRLHIPSHNTYTGWSNCSAPRTEGGYIVGSSTSVPGDTSRAALFWFNANGIVTNYRELDLPGQEWIGRQAKQTPDAGYVLCGETSTTGVLDAFLLKTDPDGELEWVRTFGSENFREGFATVEVLEDGGFWLGGGKQSSQNNYDPWVVRTDETGTILWQNTYGTLGSDPTNAHLTLGSTGNGLIATCWNVAPNDISRIALLALDPDGSVQWQRLYGPQRNTALFVVQEVTPALDLITCGFAYIGSQPKGILLRTTATGDSLWMREYDYYDAEVTNGKGAFYDVQPTPDGGFIAVGVALGVPGQYTQDVWVVKTDSMGCIEPGCHVITGVETQITNLKNVLRVWPNPVAAGSAMQVCVELPEGFAVQGQLRLTITDALGRLVQEQNIPSTSGTIPLSLGEGLGVRGIYHLHLSEAQRWISGVSFVVE